MEGVKKPPKKEPPPVVVKPKPERPCVYLGPVLFKKDCQTCPRETIRVPVHACQLHGACTQRRLGLDYQACAKCTDKRESPPAPKPLPNKEDPGGWLFDPDGRKADALKGIYRGRSCFLLCGGPSLAEMPLHELNQPGILTAAVNNAAVLHRVNVWFCVDKPGHFHPQILRDPGCMKFIKRKHANQQLRDQHDGRWMQTGEKACKMPNVWFYDYMDGWPADFLTSTRPTWGTSHSNDPYGKGQRSVMLIALRILYWLGIRTVYLIGADFKMTPERPYAFEESKGEPACHSNNKKFARLNQWFAELRPLFEHHGYRVFNASNGGQCEGFPRSTFAEALEQSRQGMPQELKTWGLYKGF